MNSLAHFRGIGGLELQAVSAGNADDPAVILMETGSAEAGFWTDLAAALVRAGRQVIRLPVPKGETSRLAGDMVSGACENLRAVLNQLPSRPAVIAAGDLASGALAIARQEPVPPVTGLVLIDPALPAEAAAAPAAALPILSVFGAVHTGAQAPLARVRLDGGEAVEIEGEGAPTAAERLETLSAACLARPRNIASARMPARCAMRSAALRPA